MTSAKVQKYDCACTECGSSIAPGAAHYQIYYEVRRLQADVIDVEYAETIATLCVKCSLLYDLTKLLIPTAEQRFGESPIGDDGVCKLECRGCHRQFGDGNRYDTAFILPIDLSSALDGATIELSFCELCAGRLYLQAAVPPTSKPGSPRCYECGNYKGFERLIVADPCDYTKRHGWPIELRWDGTVNVCEECFLGGLVCDGDEWA